MKYCRQYYIVLLNMYFKGLWKVGNTSFKNQNPKDIQHFKVNRKTALYSQKYLFSIFFYFFIFQVLSWTRRSCPRFCLRCLSWQIWEILFAEDWQSCSGWIIPGQFRTVILNLSWGSAPTKKFENHWFRKFILHK